MLMLMLILMLMLCPLAVTPGLSHGAAQHRPSDGLSFLSDPSCECGIKPNNNDEKDEIVGGTEAKVSF